MKQQENFGKDFQKLDGKLLVETLKKLEEGTLVRIKQPDELSTAPMISKEMTKIDWEKLNAEEIKNLVRGLNPIMGEYSFYKDKKIKFWKVNVLKDEEFLKEFESFIKYKDYLYKVQSGTIIIADEKIGLYIKAKDGIIKVNEIQGENARRMNVREYLNGNKLEVGEVLVTS